MKARYDNVSTQNQAQQESCRIALLLMVPAAYDAPPSLWWRVEVGVWATSTIMSSRLQLLYQLRTT